MNVVQKEEVEEKMDLCQRLKEADSMNDSLKGKISEINQTLAYFDGKPGYKDVSIREVPQIDIDAEQKRIFAEYRGNSTLAKALAGEKTIEQNVNELARIHRGIRKFLPHRKNKEHNLKADELSELIGDRYYLRANGMLAIDNYINNLIWIAAINFCGGNIFAEIINRTYASSTSITGTASDIFRFYFPLGLTALESFSIPLVYVKMRKEAIAKAREQAQYLDQKIHSLYPEKRG